MFRVTPGASGGTRTRHGVNMMPMTATIEAPAHRAADETTTGHFVVFSDPEAVKAQAVRDLNPSKVAAPVFSSAC